MWNVNHNESVDVLENLRMSIPQHKREVPGWRPSGDGSIRNEQRQTLCTYNWKRSSILTRQLDQVRKSRLRLQANVSQPQPVLNLFQIFYLRTSADRVNVWSLLILRGLNHHWNVKWTMKRSLHHWDHIIRLIIIIACYMQYMYFFSIRGYYTKF